MIGLLKSLIIAAVLVLFVLIALAAILVNAREDYGDGKS